MMISPISVTRTPSHRLAAPVTRAALGSLAVEHSAGCGIQNVERTSSQAVWIASFWTAVSDDE